MGLNSHCTFKRSKVSTVPDSDNECGDSLNFDTEVLLEVQCFIFCSSLNKLLPQKKCSIEFPCFRSCDILWKDVFTVITIKKIYMC